MSYDQKELSAYDAYAVELYLFEGTFNTYRLTTHANPITYDGHVYTDTAGLSRQNRKIAAAHGASTGEMQVDIPYDHPLATEYAYIDIPPTLNFTLLRGHLTDLTSEFRILWTGPVTKWSVKGRTASLHIPSTFAEALSRVIPSKRWQRPCNHLLYDARCGVSRASFSHSTTISSISGVNVLLVNLPWTGTEGNGGELVNNVTGERRSIVSHSVTNVTLKIPFAKAQEGHSVTAFMGCDHTGATCKAKFNNYENFGGFEHVPSVNPFQASRIR